MGQLFDDMDKIECYAVGLCNMSVCAPKDIPVLRLEQAANACQPTGIKSQWKVSDDKTFNGGESNPCQCNEHPFERLHYLMNC